MAITEPAHPSRSKEIVCQTVPTWAWARSLSRFRRRHDVLATDLRVGNDHARLIDVATQLLPVQRSSVAGAPTSLAT